MNLNEAIKNIKSNKDAENFLKDLCTPSELKALEERWNVAKLLYVGKYSYRDIASKSVSYTHLRAHET